MAPPILNQHLSFGQRAEDLAVEQFIPHFTIETLDVAVLPGAAFLDEQRSDVQARQPVADALSDRVGRKPLITGGLWVQSLGIALFVTKPGEAIWALAPVVMGLGTGMVYPTLLAAVSDLAHPSWRASALGVYRLWRDGGYAVGALVGGILSDLFTIQIAVLVIAGLTAISGGICMLRLPETAPSLRPVRPVAETKQTAPDLFPE